MNEVTCHRLRTEDQASQVAALVWEFLDHLRARYPERVSDIDTYVEYQDIPGQLTNWRDTFIPPNGECFLATLDGTPAGIAMLRRLDARVCEMNRMYVTDSARGHGVGRSLADNLITTAREIGFKEMRLDAWDRHEEALPLYASLGFEREYREDLKPAKMSYEMVHMRRML